MEKPQILILEDDQNMRFVLDECLRREGYQCILTADAEECLEKFMALRPPVALLDYKIPKGTGLEVLEKIIGQAPETLVIMLTGHATVDIAVEAMKKGAFDFIAKPFETDELMAVVESALQKRRTSEENISARKASGKDGNGYFSAVSAPAMLKILKSVDKVASSDYTILIEGESGTGKSMIAREIH